MKLIKHPGILVFCVGFFLDCELAPAEVTRTQGKIAEGTKWETDFYRIDSNVEGETVLIVGGMHGNEPAGSYAAEQIRHWPVVKGSLVVIPRANVLALQANKRLTPGEPKEKGNLNRNFPHPGTENRATPRGLLAMALWKFAGKLQPDWVIDLHEGFEFHRSHRPGKGKKKSVGSSVIYEGSEHMDPLVEKVIAAANATVSDEDKRFSQLRSGPVETGLAQACIQVMGAEGLILETTYRDQSPSLRTRQHRAMVNELLNHIGTIDQDCRNFLTGPGKQGHIRVAKFDGVGTGGAKWGTSGGDLASIVQEDKTLSLHFLGAEEMRPEILEQFDVVVFPGGSGSKQAGAIGRSGREAVREFVETGGGYVGVCAGAYLCSSHYDWSLDLVDSSVFTGSREIPGEGKKQMWYRGGWASVEMELTKKGQSLFPKIGQETIVRYANGPIISPKGLENLEDYQVLAWFRSENGLWEPQKGTMIDTPAIVSGRFGEGRVMSISPHPERTKSLHSIIRNSIQWVAKEL
ncbi:MAG: BPL-N domain-containing protein [Verrucomicrobiales bacterium]|nr:BPL-N domain-containing protein [Verrucomicrobiales bacterium]